MTVHELLHRDRDAANPDESDRGNTGLIVEFYRPAANRNIRTSLE